MNIARARTFRLKELTDSQLRFPGLFERWVHTCFILLTKKYSLALCFQKIRQSRWSKIRLSFDLREPFVLHASLPLRETKTEKISLKIRDEKLDKDSFLFTEETPLIIEGIEPERREGIIGIRVKSSSRFRNFLPGQSATRCSSTCVWRDFIPRSITGSSTVTSR